MNLASDPNRMVGGVSPQGASIRLARAVTSSEVHVLLCLGAAVGCGSAMDEDVGATEGAFVCIGVGETFGNGVGDVVEELGAVAEGVTCCVVVVTFEDTPQDVVRIMAASTRSRHLGSTYVPFLREPDNQAPREPRPCVQ